MDIESTDIDISHSNEYGNIFTFNCPECNMEVVIADYMSNKSSCQCNVKWNIELKAVGYRKDDPEAKY